MHHKNKGVIVAHHGIAVDILFDSGQRQLVNIKKNSGHVVGDNVIVEDGVLERLTRRTELCRRNSRGSVRTVGANLDVLGIVVSVLPVPPFGFIDQAIVSARQANLIPVVVMNKSDLEGSKFFASQLKDSYGDCVDVFVISAETGEGLEAFESFLGQGYRGFFIGITGVGKSSLINAMLPELDLRVGELYEAGKRGCNTTTVSTLHPLKGGGQIVDTPGFNEFGLVDITVQDLAGFFPGFEKALETPCRFRDCLHRTEPGCSVRKMAAASGILQERYDAYLQILELLEAGEERFRTRR